MAKVGCPECLEKVEQEELDLFGGLCEECTCFNDEAKSMDEKFADDCDAAHRMSEAKKLK